MARTLWELGGGLGGVFVVLIGLLVEAAGWRWALRVLAGLMLVVKLAGLSVRRKVAGHEADKSACVACLRCYDACPRERLRRGLPVEGIDTDKQATPPVDGDSNE